MRLKAQPSVWHPTTKGMVRILEQVPCLRSTTGAGRVAGSTVKSIPAATRNLDVVKRISTYERKMSHPRPSP
jgi:hypothetical protein